MIRALTILAALAFTIFAAHADNKATLPPYFALPPGVALTDGDNSLHHETYGQAEIYDPATTGPLMRQGKLWLAALTLANPSGDASATAIWQSLEPSFASQGWTVAAGIDAPAVILHRTENGNDVWAEFRIFAADDIRTTIIETGLPPLALVAPKPATKPENLAKLKGDFPFLPSLKGSELTNSSVADEPLQITFEGSDEIQLVGSSTVAKAYAEPPFLSPLLFILEYEHALTAAGWTVISKGAGGSYGDSFLIAHYAQDGRDIWAKLLYGSHSYNIEVADAGAKAPDLAADLQRDCHVALTGVLFDFNKATLKPESDTVLNTVLALLTKQPELKLEIQGHTDNVGSDEYNQTLSEQRAKSVVDWLVAHGVAADRLTSKGYGETVPIASNDDDAGRARNRRVEIARQDCSAK